MGTLASAESSQGGGEKNVVFFINCSNYNYLLY